MPGDLSGIQGGAFLQWFIAAAPGHPYLQAVLGAVLRGVADYRAFKQGVGRDAVLRLTGPVVYTRAIHPIRGAFPHRYVKSDDDLRFVFSIYGDHKSHRNTHARHYSQLARPVVLTDMATTLAAAVWFGGIRPYLRKG